jgi:aminocarboxymuconate-semialdehyde decarboxylase
MRNIDIHSHFFPESWPDFSARFGTPDWPWLKHLENGEAMVMVGNREFRRIQQVCWDPVLRLEDLDRQGVDRQVISATPVLFSYNRPAQEALEVARIFNDAGLEFCSRSNGRLIPICQVPLQDIDLACAELTRCMKSGHRGVQIGNHVGAKNLDDPGLITFLHHCADEGAAVLVHPWDMMAPERMPKYMTPWTVAMPAETQLAVSTLILSGAFDHLPRSLRICFAHGGGSFAFLLGRLQNAWIHQPLCRGASQFPPMHYVDRFSVDSAVFDQRSLNLLVEVMGEDRIMLGSDYPYPLGEEHIGELIRTSDLPADVKTKMLAGNAECWLGLTPTTSDVSPTLGEGTVAGGCPFGRENGDSTQSSEKQRMSGAPGDRDSSRSSDAPLTYGSYLHVPDLLKLQNQLSSPPTHDELLFIIIHQTYELWFKELLHDLDAVCESLSSVASRHWHDQVYEAARLLRRCTEIMRVLVNQFTILETMLPTHFMAFRGKLEPASGFQSEQFREIEFLCGLKDEKLLRLHEREPEAYARLQRRLLAPSLHDVFFDALAAIGKLPPFPQNATDDERFQLRAEAVRNIYEDEHNYRDWIDVCERLTEFDELMVAWRLRHIQVVERIIGARHGTGGSEGASYLRTTLAKRLFPELWEARTMLHQPDATPAR